MLERVGNRAGLHLLMFVAAWLIGNAVQLRQATLAGAAVVLACVAFAVLSGILLFFTRGIASRPCVQHVPAATWVALALRLTLFVLAVAALGFATTTWRAGLRLAETLDPMIEGQDLVLTGVVATLPRRSPEGLNFIFEVESGERDGVPVKLPARISLGWYGPGWGDADAEVSAVPRLAAAERWRLPVRLRRPHGLMNPHGFDFELWLFERGLTATGTVRPGPVAQRLGLDRTRIVERVRQAARDAIEARVQDPRASGLLAALAVGDQSAIDRAEWDLYRDTGVSHLMSISGMHVTMFAWLASGVVGMLWRRSFRACLWCPSPTAARIGGVLLALGYAVVAGWGVPSQRTVWMLATVVLLQILGRRWPWPITLAFAALVVVVIDPWAWLQPGFWLSFVAVGLLMLSDASPEADAAAALTSDAPAVFGWKQRLGRSVRQGLRAQLIATLGLAPLSMLFFQQVSVVGLAANLIAIPLITLVITPLALLGMVAPPLWSVAELVISGLHAVLGLLAALPGATWVAPVAPWWAQAAGLAAGLLAVAPLPWRARAFALPLALPLLWPVVDRPAHGRYEAVALDVGQGTSVLVRTASSLMIFDTGPVYARERDAGERVLLPLLRARGENRVDQLVLSHQDSDHVGGAAALIKAVPVRELWSSLPASHALRKRGLMHRPCEAGASWQADGVAFEVLHPRPEAEEAAARRSTNALSCVLRVVDAQGRSLLLTGDIEAPQEQALIASGQALRADMLIVAHHGSRTSTTTAWLDAVSPSVAVVQAGYRNRFGHPAPAVEQRLLGRGIQVLRSDRCGAWSRYSDGSHACERESRRRYWHHVGH
jgi:competence protein ComEC